MQIYCTENRKNVNWLYTKREKTFTMYKKSPKDVLGREVIWYFDLSSQPFPVTVIPPVAQKTSQR
jgi:hypothetical protein